MEVAIEDTAVSANSNAGGWSLCYDEINNQKNLILEPEKAINDYLLPLGK